MQSTHTDNGVGDNPKVIIAKAMHCIIVGETKSGSEHFREAAGGRPRAEKLLADLQNEGAQFNPTELCSSCTSEDPRFLCGLCLEPLCAFCYRHCFHELQDFYCESCNTATPISLSTYILSLKGGRLHILRTRQVRSLH